MKVDDELRALIKKKREAFGWSQPELAAHAGTSQQNVHRIEAGQVGFSRAVPLILKALDIKPSLASNAHSRPSSPELILPSELVGERDLPVYAAVAGGKGQMIISVDPLQYVRRPDQLSGVPKGYGIIIAGDSMEPAYWHGDIALVHPHLTLRTNVDVVLYRGEDVEPREAIIKRLVRHTIDAWHLIQWNPPEGEAREFVLYKDEWPICHYVVGRFAAR